MAVAAGVAITPVHHVGPLSGGPSAWRLDLGDGTGLRARFLVDASGRSAALLRQLRVRRIPADRQIAILATYSDDGDAYCGTTVEAVSGGWWYTTPLPGGRRVLAYLTDADLWRDGARDWQTLLRRTHHVGGCAGQNAMATEPGTYPAGAAQADHLVGEGWLAVGDAAASFDPLSSQGLASAILMGARAGEALADVDRNSAIDAWAEDYSILIAEHADLRTHYARLEQRWPNADFWRRRQEPDDAVTKPRLARQPQLSPLSPT
jgi:flavin-dependent dehydrogenase